MSGNEVYVSDNARNGLVTAVGIILGFALAFLIKFSMDSGDWKASDFPTLILLLIGIIIIIMIFSLYRALIPYKQEIRYYETTVKIFIFGGVSLLFLGIFFAFVF